MHLKKIKVGPIEENCYIISDKYTVIIDPGDEALKILDYIKTNNLNLAAILITHHHFDHVGALNEILNYKNVPIYDNTNLEEKDYLIGGFNIEVIKTPGHTSDSLTYYFKDYNMMFVGDFIFKGNVGRWDLETGSYEVLMESIDKIKKYDINTIIYPGHGMETILSKEIKSNNFFKR